MDEHLCRRFWGVESKMQVHIVGIAGKATSAIAKMFQDQGSVVTGSDTGVYPPASTFLESIGIEIQTPYAAEHVDSSIDLVVVGGNVIKDPHNPEVQHALALGIPVITYPQALERLLVKKHSIVVAGNYGKGTIAGAIAKALTDLGCEPSFMIGGQMVDFENNVRATDSEWSVLEGDEYPVPPLINHAGSVVQKEQSKFFFYHPKYMVLTSTQWDHFDKFETPEVYHDNYEKLIQQLPEDGLLVVNAGDKGALTVAQHAPCNVVTFGFDETGADYTVNDLDITPQIIGSFNRLNLTAAYALLSELGFNQKQIQDSLESYKGLVQRMEVIHKNNEYIVIRDYAHSPLKAAAAISAVREEYPDYYITAVFDIYASSLKNRAVLPELRHRFTEADQVLIPKVNVSRDLERDQAATGKDIVAAIKVGQPNTYYTPKDEAIIEHISLAPKPQVILLMSSGSVAELEDSLKKL